MSPRDACVYGLQENDFSRGCSRYDFSRGCSRSLINPVIALLPFGYQLEISTNIIAYSILITDVCAMNGLYIWFVDYNVIR